MGVSGGTSDDVRRRRAQCDLARRRQNAAVNLLPGLGQHPIDAAPTVDDLQRYFVARLAQRQRYQLLDGYDALLESEYPDLITGGTVGSVTAMPAAMLSQAVAQLRLTLLAVLSLAVRLTEGRLPVIKNARSGPEESPSLLNEMLTVLAEACGAGRHANGDARMSRGSRTRPSHLQRQAKKVSRFGLVFVPVADYSDSLSRTDTALAAEGRISALVE